MINGISSPALVGLPFGATGDMVSDDSADAFAAILCGVLNVSQQPVAPAPVAPTDCTSELDGPSDDSDAGTGGTFESSATEKVDDDVQENLPALGGAHLSRDGRTTQRLTDASGDDAHEAESTRGITERGRHTEPLNERHGVHRAATHTVAGQGSRSKPSKRQGIDITAINDSAGPESYEFLQRLFGMDGMLAVVASDPGSTTQTPSDRTQDAAIMSPSEPADASGSTGASIARAPHQAIHQLDALTRLVTPASAEHSAVSAAPIEAPEHFEGVPAAAIETPGHFKGVPAAAIETPEHFKGAPAAAIATPEHFEAGAAAATEVSVVELQTSADDERPQIATISAPKPEANDRPSLETLSAVRLTADVSKHSRNQTSSDNTDRRTMREESRTGASYPGAESALHLRTAEAAYAPIHETSAATGAESAERVAKVMSAFESAPARPLSRITMNVDAGNGQIDRVQVALRGSSVGAVIHAADPRAAQQMNARANELSRSLAQDGLELEMLQVRAAISPTAAPEAPRSSSTSHNNSQFERSNGWQQAGERQRSREDRRQQERFARTGKQQ